MKKALKRKVVSAAYKKISHADRIKIIYQNTVHQITVGDISREMGIKYNSIRNILRAYEQSGRTNKKKYFRTQPQREDHKASAEGNSLKETSQGWDSIKPASIFQVKHTSKNADPWISDSADPTPAEVSPEYPQAVSAKAPLRLPKLSISLEGASPDAKPGSSQRCGLSLYVCQGQATIASDKNDEKQNQFDTNPHVQLDDYEKLFVFNNKDRGYPYHGDVQEQDWDDAENVGLDIVTYENGKKLTQFFTGELSLFNKYISKHQQHAALQGCSELEKKLALRLLKTLPQDKNTVLKLLGQTRSLG